MTNTQALESQVRQYGSEIAKVQAAFAHVAAKRELPAELAAAGRVMIKNGYATATPGESVLAFTAEGLKFWRSMKKFAPRVARILDGGK